MSQEAQQSINALLAKLEEGQLLVVEVDQRTGALNFSETYDPGMERFARLRLCSGLHVDRILLRSRMDRGEHFA